MKKGYSVLRRALALLMSLMLLLPTAALASGMRETLLLGVQWTDAEGNPQYAQAAPIAYPGYENSYWVQVPGDAFYALSLTVQDLTGVYAAFDPGSGTPLSGLIADAGSGLMSAMPLEITAFTADGQPALLLRLYVSTVTAQPEQPQVAIPDATITVRYLNQDGLDIASATQKTLPAGTHEVYPEAYDLLPDYALRSAGSQTVTVNEQGANPAQVVFYYDFVKPPVQPVSVTVHYLDADSYAPVASDTAQTVEEGTHEVYPAPYDLPGEYQLAGDGVAYVTVNESGASPAEVNFLYHFVKPPVQPVSVTVHYLDADSYAPVASDTAQTVEEGTHEVYPAPYDLRADYELVGDSVVYVTVDEYGASPAEVTFLYHFVKPPVQPVSVTVHYLDAATYAPVASDTAQTVEEGTHEVYPNPFDLLPDYEQTGENVVYVTVDEYGASPAEVTFLYNYIKPAVQPAAVIVRYVDDATGEPIAADTEMTLPEGTHEVRPAPETLPENYALIGENSAYVTVDENGANPAEVTFRYAYQAPAPTTQMMTVPCVDETGVTISTFDCEVTLNSQNDIYLPVVPEGYTLSGSGMIQVYVDAEGNASPVPIFCFVKNAPVVTEPVQIAVRYLDQTSGEPVALDQFVPCEPGQATVITAQPVGLQEGYMPVGGSEVSVWVDENGYTENREVIFYYAKESVTPTDAPPTVEPCPVAVRYLNQSGEPIAPDEWLLFQPGDTVYPAPQSIGDYVLDGADSVTVHVDENGAAPDTVTFVYRQNQAVPKIALVPVKYMDGLTGNVFYSDAATCQENQENLIYVDREIAAQCGYGEYEPDKQAMSVQVDSDGTAFPAEVIFSFVKNEQPVEAPTDAPAVTEAPVTVRYETKDGLTVASPQEVTCYPGSNLVEARPFDLAEGYDLIGESVCQVVLDNAGVLTPAQVVFLYAPVQAPTEAPTDTPLPDVGVIDRWGETNTKVNFRSGMSTSSKKVAGKESIANGTKVWIVSADRVDGQKWYAVMVDGRQGYLSAEFVDVYSQQESDAVQGSLSSPVPTQTPPETPAPATDVPTLPPVTEAPATEIPATESPATETPAPVTPVPTSVASPVPLPDVGVIDRWGETTTKVNFRSDMSASAARVKGMEQIASKTRVFVQSSDIVEEQKWYAVLVNGKEGYVSANYVNVFTQEESDIIQRSLPSPVPTQALDRTPVPATDIPATDAPTETPAPTATPEPYTGYAVTQWQIALRPGVSDADVLEWLANDSLVYISGQTVVNGTVYSSVQALSSGNYGFVEDKALLHITTEEARPYLDRLLPAEVTPTPVPEQVQGFAMTQWNGVPLRQFADTNGAIIQLLPYSAVARVISQTYTGIDTWHLVQYNGVWGYVRADQMRMMSEDETIAYLQSLEQQQAFITTAPPAPTPPPVDSDSPSSYGHVRSNSGKVNLRAQPSKSSQRLRLLDNYAFALWLGTVENSEGLWYHVIQDRTEGYINADYFKVLSLSELNEFLKSPEYRSTYSESSEMGTSSSQLASYEDHVRKLAEAAKKQWEGNPLPQPSYETFKLSSPTPDPEALPTPSPVPSAVPTPTVTPEILPVGGMTTPEPDTKGGTSVWPWVLIGLAAVGGGGAYYAYTVYRRNERRRQAVRAQQMQRARQNQAANQPQMRAARNNPEQQGTRTYNSSAAAPFMPPQGAAPKPAVSPAAKPDQATDIYRPSAAQSAYRAPAQASGQNMDGTQKYTPANSAAYRQNAAARGETQAYQPVIRKAAEPSGQAGVYQPAETAKPASSVPAQGTETQRPRQRRSDRYKNDNA